MKPANESPLLAAICLASAIASAGVSTPARLRPVSHSTATERARSACAAGRRQSRDDGRIVGDDGDVDAAPQRREARHLLVADQVVGDQDVVEPAIRHHLGLAELLAGDALCAGIALQRCEQRALVGLDVRTIGDAGGIALGLHPRDVAFDAVHVDDKSGRSVFACDLLGERCGHGHPCGEGIVQRSRSGSGDAYWSQGEGIPSFMSSVRSLTRLFRRVRPKHFR